MNALLHICYLNVHTFAQTPPEKRQVLFNPDDVLILRFPIADAHTHRSVKENMLLNGYCLLFSSVSAIFFVVACIGYSNDFKTLQSVPWIRGKHFNSDRETSFGLRAYTFSSDSGNRVVEYSEQRCVAHFCDECERDGVCAFGLLIVAAVFMTVEAVICALRFSSVGITANVIHFGVSLVGAVLSLVALNLFMGVCYDDIDNTQGVRLKWATGGILAVIGMILSWFVVFARVFAALQKKLSLETGP
jgi:hypothetical protein